MDNIIKALEEMHGANVVHLSFSSLSQMIDAADVEAVSDEFVDAIKHGKEVGIEYFLN